MKFKAMSRRAVAVLTLSSAVAASSAISLAAETDGSVTSGFASSGVAYLDGLAYSKMAVDSNGKIIVAANIDDEPDPSYGPEKIRVTRLNADGSVDTGFGTAGSFDITGLSGWTYIQVSQLLVDSQNRPIVVFNANNTGVTNQSGVVARLTSTGALDTSFSSDGYTFTVTPSLRSNDVPSKGFVHPTSDNIYLLGGINGLDLFRITPAGVQDTSFFTDGHMEFRYYGLNSIPALDMGFGFRGNPKAFSIDADEQGGRVVLTKSFGNPEDTHVVIIKLDFSADEAVPYDDTWGPDVYTVPATCTGSQCSADFANTTDGRADGFTILNPVASSTIEGQLQAEILADGSVLGVVHDSNSPYNTQLFKWTAAGVVDSSFASNGATTPTNLFGDYSAPTMVIGGDNSVTLLGKTSNYQNFGRLVRYTAAGVLDSSFGTNGSLDQTTCGNGSFSAVKRLADGSVLILSQTGYGSTAASKVFKFGIGGSTTTCGTTTTTTQPGGGGSMGGGGSNPGSGGGGGMGGPTGPLSPAPTISVGQSGGALTVCVVGNGTSANFAPISVRPSSAASPNWPPAASEVIYATDDYLLAPDVQGRGTVYRSRMGRFTDWTGQDVLVTFEALTKGPYGDGMSVWTESEVVREPFVVGTEYRVSASAYQVNSTTGMPVAGVPSAPILYTFGAADVDCGVSASSNSDTTTTLTTSGGSGTTAQAPSLVTSANQEQLTATAGTAKILINGELVEVNLVQAPADLRRTSPGARTFAEVRALQTLAQDMVAAVQAVLGQGATLPITIQNTSTGATVTGLVTDPVTGLPLAVPVEDVLLVVNDTLALMVGGADGAGDPANIAFDGVLEFGEGGYVAVLAYGLTPGVSGEVVVMSSPRLLKSFAVGADGGVAAQAQIPTDLAAGDHTVVVTVGDQAASLGFRVLAPGLLPSTGGDSTPLPWAVLVLAAGAFAVLTVTRRRNVI